MAVVKVNRCDIKQDTKLCWSLMVVASFTFCLNTHMFAFRMTKSIESLSTGFVEIKL